MWPYTLEETGRFVFVSPAGAYNADMIPDFRKSSRRAFLKGKSALEALEDAAAQVGGGPEPPAAARSDTAGRAAPDGLLMQVGRRAMACQFQIMLAGDRQGSAVDAALEALDRVDEVESQLTVYRDNSEVSQVNRLASRQACPIQRSLLNLIQRCVDLSQRTGGAFDITAAPLVRIWGFHIRQGRLPSDDEIHEALQNVGSHLLQLDEDAQTIFFQRPGLELNFGSVGKGYALDQCASVLDAAPVENYLIHGGHSSILARGSQQQDGQQRGWWIGLPHPLRPDQKLAEILLQDQALGTSGSGRQFFYHRGRRYGHVLDPRSGRPAEGVLSATVLSPRAEQADALATAFFVMGLDAARQYCQQHPELSAVLVCPGGRSGSTVLETIGMDDNLRVLD
jgi:thiamine biosynthesis lipoprotein